MNAMQTNQTRKQKLLRRINDYLVEEVEAHKASIPAITLPDGLSEEEALWLNIRALMNVRPPWPATDEFLATQDELLQILIADAGIHTAEDATPSPDDDRLLLWKGDITTLEVDAIVNAANSAMTGCWAPLHYCIDNAIQTYAGIQMRAECAALMEEQGHSEPTAQAKVTSAYNLPSKWVIHTVGPIANGQPTQQDGELLAQSYTACLDAFANLVNETASENGSKAESMPKACNHTHPTIAFPCISTGVFGFPQAEAAPIAVSAVRNWLDTHQDSNIRVVFNVFNDTDEYLYKQLLVIE